MKTAIKNEKCAGLAKGLPAPRPVLAVGAVMVDALCQVPRLPMSGEGVVVESVNATLGGCALNAAAAVRDAGVECRLFAPLGVGMFAGFVESRLGELGFCAFRPSKLAGCAAAGLADAFAAGEGASFDPVAVTASATTAAAAIPAGHRDSGACVCFVEPDGQRTMVTLPGVERHFQDDWFAELDAELVAALDAGSSAEPGGEPDEEPNAQSGAEPGAALDEGCPDAASARGFSCALVSGFEVGGPGGEAIVRFFERHPLLPLFFGPGPLLTTFPPELIERVNRLHPIWHLNDQEALAFTGCATVEAAGLQLAHAAGNACVITAGAQGSYVFLPDSPERPEACIFVPSTPVPSSLVVDTVGAGDTHLGALAAAFARGMNWEDSLAAANEAAARVVQLPGGMLPSR